MKSVANQRKEPNKWNFITGRPLISPETRRKRGIYNDFDWGTFVLFALLLVVSLIVMSTASSNVVEEDPGYYFRREALMMALGFGAFIFVTLFDYRRIKDWTRPVYMGICVLLLITMIFGTGDGANRWLFGIQPSELGKVVMIVLFAAYLDNNRKLLNDSRFILKSMLYMALPMGLVFLEPDLGTSLVFLVVMLAMLYVAGANRKVFGLVVGGIAAMVLLIFTSLYFYTHGFTVSLSEDIPFLPLKKYQLMRLAIFINPEMDALSSGYHIIQSKIAIGSGGLFGKGYGQGTQVQGNFLPEHHTDFIFAVIGEEFGFFLTAGILILFMVFLLRLAKKAFSSRDFYGTLIITGVCTMMMFQVFVNAGMAMGIMPITGLPMPFFSYGGTSVIVNMMAVALVFSVSLRGKKRT
jgi:rod shape determining protein RodA